MRLSRLSVHHAAAALSLVLVWLMAHQALALSIPLPHPQIYYPKGYDTNRAAQIESALQNKSLKYLDGLTSYWEPEWSTTLAYGGDAAALNELLAALHKVGGVTVRLTFSKDLSKETGSALSAGSWWVNYSHTMPDTITIRINLAAETLGGDKFELRLPKQADAAAASTSEPGGLEEGKILTIARQAVATNDTWLDRAEFELPKHQADGSGWSVHVWRLPKTPGGDRLIKIDEKGQVTEYLRGH
jgi:hypothetical protein